MKLLNINRRLFLIIYTLVVAIVCSVFYIYVAQSTPAPFVSPVFSESLLESTEIMNKYNLCYKTGLSKTNLQLVECKAKVADVWFFRGKHEAYCDLNQVKAVTVACDPIIAAYVKK